MLDMGFIEDIEWILEQAPAERQTASSRPPCRRASPIWRSRYMREPQRITVAGKQMTVPQVRQSSYEVPARRKARCPDPHPRRRDADLGDDLLPHQGGRR